MRCSHELGQRLKRVFKIDIQTWEQGGGAVRVIVRIKDPAVIKKLLEHLAQPIESAATTSHPRPGAACARPLGRILTSSYADRMDAGAARCIANAPLVSNQWNILQTPAFHLPTHNNQSQPGSVGSLNLISSCKISIPVSTGLSFQHAHIGLSPVIDGFFLCHGIF